MKAISITPGTQDVHLIDYPEPVITSQHQVKLKILEVGICGTDREQVVGGRANSPKGSTHLILGHEMLGRVVDKGKAVTSVNIGDYGVFSVRRGCGKCVPCMNNRSDMCYSGQYTERGIKELHGYESEFVVDEEQYLVKVPPSIASIGVLTEPMSVSEKAIDEALAIQAARLPMTSPETWIHGKKVLVAGMGAIGLLASIALRLRGAEVWGLDIVEPMSMRPQLLQKIGGHYIDGRTTKTMNLDDMLGQVDLIFEATGIAEIGFQLIDVLGTNGIYVMTGIPHGERPVCIFGAELMAQMVLRNQVVVGSVNASPKHFAMAISDLEKAYQKWRDVMESVITTRISYHKFREALDFRSADDIKTVIEWSNDHFYKPSQNI